MVLFATGRTPNSDLLDLGAGRSEIDDDGRVVVDELPAHHRARHLRARRRLAPITS